MRIPLCLSVVLLTVLPGAPAFAQEAPLTKVYACADIADSTARLACFDGAVAGLRQAETGGEVALVTREQITNVETAAFGLSMPSLPSLGIGPAPAKDAPRVERVTLDVTKVEKGADGKLWFTMANGQVWRQTDTMRLNTLGKGPWKAEIRKASMGGFFLNLDDRKAVRAKRVE